MGKGEGSTHTSNKISIGIFGRACSFPFNRRAVVLDPPDLGTWVILGTELVESYVVFCLLLGRDITEVRTT